MAWFDWCWLDWPQMKQPLSKKSRDYVLKLNIEADVRMLQERLNMQNDVLDYYRSSCQVLKAGVRAGLSLYDICSAILCRNDPGGEFVVCICSLLLSNLHLTLFFSTSLRQVSSHRNWRR